MFEPKSASELMEHYRAVKQRLHPPPPPQPKFPARPKPEPKPKPKEPPPPPPPPVVVANPVGLSPRVTIDLVITLASRVYGVDRRTLVSTARFRRYTDIRHILAYVLWSLMQGWITSPIIGRRMGGRDHTTILHSYRYVSRKIDQKDPATLAMLEMLLDAILNLEKENPCLTTLGRSENPTET